MQKVVKYLVSFILFPIIIITSCSKDDGISLDSGKIKTGPRKEVHRQLIPVSGGTIDIPNTGTPVDEMTITIPENSYTNDKEFIIAYYEILDHAYGSKFKPVTPLIEVNNGGDFADRVMYLGVQTSASPEQKLAPFYYDRVTGKLESIPILASFDGVIAIAVRHFSLIVVGSFEKEVIELGGSYSTYFDPKINGWSFANEGNWVEFGTCAGMSIGAAYYYQNRKSSLRLAEHFDNPAYGFRTPDRPYDDVEGIRFATLLQQLFDKSWQGAYGDIFESNFAGSDEDNFWSMIYGIYFNQDPQLVCVAPKDNTLTGHMVVATAYEFNATEVNISIYDPNYPQYLGNLKYDHVSKQFKPYTSAENSIALQNGFTYNFEIIKHIPLSTVVSTKEVDRLFAKTGNFTIGKDVFPNYNIYAEPIDNRYQAIKLTEALDGSKNGLPFDEFKLKFEGLGPYQSINYEKSVYYLHPLTKEWIYFENFESIKLGLTGEHLLGVHVYSAKGANPRSWIGFHYFKIEVQPIWLTASTLDAGINQMIQFEVRSNNTIPNGARFEWDFGNGVKRTIQNDTTLNYAYPTTGKYNVTVRVFDTKENKEFGKAGITINVSEKKFDRVDVIFSGLNTGDKPFVFDDGHREGNMSFSNIPAFFPHPKLTWTGNQFMAEFDYGDTTVFEKQKIWGVLSDDLNTLKEVHGYYYVEDDSHIYENTLSFKDLPVLQRDPERLISDVKGTQTEPKLISANTVYKEKQANGTLIVKYSLSSIEFSKARIYIHFTND